MITFKNKRNCGGTHRLPNKTNRNVLASKLRPVKTSKKVKLKIKKTQKLCIVEKKSKNLKGFFPPFTTVYQISER